MPTLQADTRIEARHLAAGSRSSGEVADVREARLRRTGYPFRMEGVVQIVIDARTITLATRLIVWPAPTFGLADFAAPTFFVSQLAVLACRSFVTLNELVEEIGEATADGGSAEPERSTAFVRNITNLEPPEPIEFSAVQAHLSEGRRSELLQAVVGLYQRVAAVSDVVVVEGLAATSDHPGLDTLNAHIANAIDAEVILVSSVSDGLSVFSDSVALSAEPFGGVDAALMVLDAWGPGTGAADISLALDLGTTTQFGAAFGVNSLSQDGFTTGRLTGVSVDSEGVVFARYTNGQSNALGKLALANFSNPQGLQQAGDTAWNESSASGDALLGEAGTASFGNVQSGALEGSNVDLTAQLVKMITAQRNFQANAQVISTADAVTQTVINIR